MTMDLNKDREAAKSYDAVSGNIPQFGNECVPDSAVCDESHIDGFEPKRPTLVSRSISSPTYGSRDIRQVVERGSGGGSDVEQRLQSSPWVCHSVQAFIIPLSQVALFKGSSYDIPSGSGRGENATLQTNTASGIGLYSRRRCLGAVYLQRPSMTPSRPHYPPVAINVVQTACV